MVCLSCPLRIRNRSNKFFTQQLVDDLWLQICMALPLPSVAIVCSVGSALSLLIAMIKLSQLNLSGHMPLQ